MSKSKETWHLNERAQEFFVYATLGIVPERMFGAAYQEHLKKLLNHACEDVDYQWYCVFMCAKAAYRDLCRTLEYKEDYRSGGKQVKDKEDAINAICIDLVHAIYKNGKIVGDSQAVFPVFYQEQKQQEQKQEMNDLHELNSFLKEYASKDKKKETKQEQKFRFGQAQKWVNMTLKYLYLLGAVQDPAALQIPIDSYILAALKKEYGISSTNKAWSQFNHDDYVKLCNRYEKRIEKPYIAWEHDAWIKQAEAEKGIRFQDAT